MTGDTAPPPVKVDFFCIGAGKSGSTWLAQCLDEHPQITIARNKEPNFFVRKLSAFGGELNAGFMDDWDRYAEQFAHARPEDRLGDFSVNLMHNVEYAPKLIHDLYPSAKLIVILRDPVDRTYSHYWHERQVSHIKTVPKSFAGALANQNFMYRSRYGEQLEAWRKLFPQEAFFFVFDFALEADARATIRRLFRFLDVDSDFQPPSLFARLNESSRVSPLLIHLRKLASSLRAAGFGRVLDFADRREVQDGLRSLLIRRKRYPPMPADIRERLKREFSGDLEKMEKLFDMHLRHWRN